MGAKTIITLENHLLYRRFLFVFMLFGAISGCSEGENRLEKATASVKPDATRFIREVVVDGLDEPFQVEFDEQGHVYWIERKGLIKRINELSGEVEVLGELPVTKNPPPGLIGVLLDKNFEQTR
jgi:cytochrome c